LPDNRKVAKRDSLVIALLRRVYITLSLVWRLKTGMIHRVKYWEIIADKLSKTGCSWDAPWYVVSADNKWFTRVVVAAAVIETLASLDLAYPKVDEGKLKELAAAKKKLLNK
jgi:hypothetical protein